MSKKTERESCYTLDRLLVVTFLLIGVWWDVSLPADIFSTIGSIFWLYMAQVVKLEMKVLTYFKRMYGTK